MLIWNNSDMLSGSSGLFRSEVSLFVSCVACLLIILRDKIDNYVGDGLPIIIGVTTKEIYKFLLVVPYPEKGSYQSANREIIT